MLKDTDFFTELAKWSTLGDVHAQVEWREEVSPDERYVVEISWRYRSRLVGSSKIGIHPILNTDEFEVFWVNIEFTDEWRDKNLYSELVKAYMDHMPDYGITRFIGAPSDKTAEGIYKATGFEWTGTAFALDLKGEKVQEWRAFKDGKTEQPEWRHAVLAEHGLLDASDKL